MKLHLPFSLRKALLAVLASTTYFSTADAACLHAAVSPTTYTDFGQNMARYSVYQVNELLTQIRANNGVQIPYTTDTPPATMGIDQPMISFESVNGDGAFTAVGYNYTATVAHNGCPNPCFTGRYVGEDQAVHYQGVEYRSSQNKVFLLSPSIDYKITRSSKIFTDITASGVFDTTQYLRDGGQVTDLVHYRAGAGTCDQADFEGNTHNLAGGYSYITGGVVATLGFSYMEKSATYEGYDYKRDYAPNEGPRDSRGVIDDPYTISIHGIQDYGPGGAGQPSEDNPKVYLLPFVSRGGDSGSPVWAWDENDREYKLISCHQARGGDNSYSRGASEWTMAAMEYFNEHVDMDAAGHTVHMGAVVTQGDYKYDETNKVGTTLQYGSITGADAAFEEVSFCGVGPKEGKTIYTWLSLYDRKDVQNWYSYGNTYFNANGNGSGKEMHLGDLFYTENIVFASDGSDVNNIVLDADIDMGIGYAQFTTKEAGKTAKFYLQSKENDLDRDYMLNSAGYIVDEGAELHIKVTNTQEDADGNAYFREWRKQGAGDMYLEGQGDNEIFLNLGGSGTTYLREEGGYAAYNVLINNGATLNFGGDIKQIARDVTFGNGGGYLEFSGLEDFDWYSGENLDVEADGFTVNALTQDATLINSQGNTTLHYKTGGETTFLGSFLDTENSSLTVIYEGGGTWTLNSIHTKLLNAGSSFIVQSGTAELVGQHTVHGIGSIEGKGGTRYTHPDDWHYSDAAMDVEVRDGATFRLGSHARLTGNVDVQSGGTLEIAEGVKHRYEYIEGWLIAEDTTSDFYRGFYGLKGDVSLADNATLRFKFSEGTDAENVYGGSITGAGNVDMQLGGSGATLVLSGENTFTGTKNLSGGGLVAEHETSLGDTADNKWHVKEDAFIAVKGIDGNQALEHIDADSTGVIALTRDQAEQVDLTGTGHTGMFVGALAGQVVQYGEAPEVKGHKTVYTEDRLDPVELDGQRKWQLGGGGGELVVNFLLEDSAAELVLGNEYTTGTVTLTNIWNQIGSINFAGRVTLNYTDEEALGGSKISLGYSNRVIGSSSLLKSITRSSDGVLLLDKMPEANVDLTDHHFMALGSDGDMVYSGSITPTAGGYRFGGITGTLELQTALTDGDGETRSLLVDAQGYAGGTLALATQATLTGEVVVTGHDTDRHPEFSGGDISLRLDTANAITSASRITVKEGGSIDINGTTQTFHGFNMEAGSALVDTSELWSGSAVVDVAAGATSRLEGNVDVYSLTKTGQGDMVLGGSNNYGVFFIEEGRVLLENGNALSASGTAMLESGGVLDAGGVDISASIGFAGGTLQVGTKRVAGSLAVAKGYEGTVQQNAAGITTSINSGLQVAQGATLKLSGNHGNFNFSAEEINEDGGTIALEGNRIAFTNGKEMTIGGIVSLQGQGLAANERVTLYSDGSSDNMIRNINELHIVDGQSAAIQEASWNTIWNIHSLTGSGDLKWVSNTTHWFSARLVLDGANSFSGQFTAERTYGNVSNRSYQSFVEARHDLAMQNMDVSVIGKGNQSNMALAVNTDNLQMRSLSGNGYALLYAGAALEGADHDKDEPLKAAPESTRRATLTITGMGNHTFSGNVSGQDHYIGYETKEDGTQVKVADVTNAGISIVMDGHGQQTFNGQRIRFNSVTVHSGVLELASPDLTIKEDVTITRGAELQLSQAYTLDSGKTLTVLANDPGTTAMLSGGLTLNGGTLTFSAEGLSDSAPALSIGSLSGSSVTLNFTETHAFTSDVRYHLADQDWSNVVVTDATEGLTYLTASYETDANGLYVSFTTKAGNLIWGGTDDKHDWSSRTFGPSGLVPTSNQTAVFNDAAPNHHVNITDDVKVAGLVFDAAGDYDLVSDNGSTVTAGSVVQSGSGTTILTEAVRVGSDQSHGTVTVTDGELRVTDDAVLQNVDTITGGGTLGVDFGVGNTGTVAALFAEGSSVGFLHVVSGTFEAYWTPCYAGLLLDAGAGYTVGAQQTLAYVQAGQGGGGSPAMLNLGNSKLTAAMVVMQGDLAISGSGGELHADITGGHTITTSGTVTLRGSNFDGNLHVQSGTLKLFDGANSHVAGITMDAGTTLYLGISTGLEGGATIHMGNNASLRMENGAGGSHTVNANIVMDGSSASLYGTLNGNSTVVRGSIEGHGTLFLKAQNTYWNNSWSIESLLQDGEGGALALSSDGNVTLSGTNTYSGGTTITGNRLTTNNERALGTGTLNMTAGELVLKKDLTVGGLSGSETASINLGTKRLTVDSDGNTRFSGEISNGSLAKLGSGRLELEVGGELDNISVGGGTLALGDCDVTGNLSVAAGTTLDFTGDMLRLSHAVDNAGTFRFSTSGTSIEIKNGSGFDIHTDGYLDVNGNKAENGFAQGLTIRVFENTGDGQIEGITPEVAYMGDTLTLDLATGVASRGGSNSAYTVRMGTVVYDDAFAAAPGAKAVESFSLASVDPFAPATLQLSRNLDEGVRITVSGNGGNISLDRDVVLSAGDVDIMPFSYTTLQGEGTLALDSGKVVMPDQMGLADAGEWTGSVRLSGMGFSGTDITSLANSTSRVEMYGITGGYLKQWQGSLDTNIRLMDTESGDYAWKWTDGQSTGASTITFTGTWDGSGSFVVGGKNQNFTFKGDISGWNGRYIQNGNSSTVTFSHTGEKQVVNADFERKGGNLDMAVGDGSNATYAEFQGSLRNVSSLEVKAHSTAELAGANNSIGTLTVNADAQLVNSGTTTLTGALTNSGSITNSGTLTIGTKLTNGTIANTGTLVISSLMEGEVTDYVDALDRRTSNGNGFATTTLTVRASGATITNSGGGVILYGGVDVTDDVVTTGVITKRVNYGSYRILTTDNAVTYSAIASNANGALEYISFTNGTELAVDKGEVPNLRTSQVKVEGTATLSMQDDATLVVDASTAAKVAAGDTVTLQMQTDTPTTHAAIGGLSGATVNVTGSGVLDLGSAQHTITTLNITGATVYSNHSGTGGFNGPNAVNVNAGGKLQLDNVDAMGYGGGCTASITLQGSADAHAVLELGGRQTVQGTIINMKGNAEVRAMANSRANEQRPMLDFYNGQQSINATGTNNLIAVPFRMRNGVKIDVASGGDLTLAGGTYSDYTGNTITKTGAGRLVFDTLLADYGAHNYTGTLAVNGGSVEVNADASFNVVTSKAALTVTGGTTSISTYTGSSGSSLAVQEGAALVFNGNSTLASAISNSGTVSFGDSCTTLTLSGSFEHQDNVYRDIAAGTVSTDGNGLKSGGYVSVLTGGGVVEEGVAVSYSGREYTLQADGRAYQAVETGTYYARKGTAVYNAAVAAETSIDKVSLSNGVTLDLQAGLADGVAIEAQGGMVNIGEGVILSRESLTNTAPSISTSLTGGGTYLMDVAKGTTLGNNVQLGDNWSGTLRLTGETTNVVNLDAVALQGEGYAALELAGVKAPLQDGAIHPDLVLTDLDGGSSALTVTNSGTFTFTGDISGSGHIVNTADGSTFAFNGSDLSNWSGGIENNGGLAVEISGMPSGADLNASLARVNSLSYTAQEHGDTFTVASLETNAAGTSVAGNNGTLAVNELSGGGSLTVNGSVALSAKEYTGQKITVQDGADLLLNELQARQTVLDGSGTVRLSAELVELNALEGGGTIEAADDDVHTLALHTAGVHSSSATIGANIDLEMHGNGTQTLTGDLSAFNGDIYMMDSTLRLNQDNATTIGVLNMNGGAVEFGGGSTSLGAARVTSGAQAAITVENGTSVQLGRAIQNSGSLTLSGCLDASDLAADQMDVGFINTNGDTTDNGSGFIVRSDAVRVVRNVSGGTLNADAATVRYGQETVHMDEDGLAILESDRSVLADTYYLRDEAVYSAIVGKAVEHGGALEHVAFDAIGEASLTLDATADSSMFSVDILSVANIELTPSAKLAMGEYAAGADGEMRISGNGTVQLSNRAALARHTSLTPDWRGSVVLTGSSNGVNLGADGGLWTNGSTAEFNNWCGTLAAGSNEVGAAVLLNGMTLNASGTDAAVVFNNTVGGTGNLVNNSGADLSLDFNGDISGWRGALVTNSGSTTTVNLNADHAQVNAAIEKDAEGNVNIYVDKAAAFNARVHADTLAIGDGGAVEIADEFSVGDIMTYGSVTVDEGASLNVSGSISDLKTPIVNNGAVSFTGAEVQNIYLDKDSEFAFSAVTYTDKDGTTTAKGNGFRTGGTATLIDMRDGSTLSGAENVIVSYRGALYTMLDDGTFGDRNGAHTYYIHEGEVSYSDIKDTAGLVGLHLDNTLVPEGNATLNLDANLAPGLTSGIYSDGGTVNLAQGVLLKASQLHANAATSLTGDGLYDLGESIALGITLGDGWTGTVRMANVEGLSGFNLSNYAKNSDATVAVRGLAGWLDLNTNLQGRLMLEHDATAPDKAALNITAASQRTYTFAGGVTGQGDMLASYTGANATFQFQGDLSDWTGAFISTGNDANTTSINLKDTTSLVGAAIRNTSANAAHKVNVTVDNTAQDVYLNGALEGINTLTYNSHANGRALHIADLTTNASGTTLNFTNGQFAALVEVDSLHGSGKLTLDNTCKSDGLAHFAINGGDYSGATIEFNAMHDGYSNGARRVLLTIGDEHVAEHSVINTTINKNGGGTVNVGIGIAADTVRVGGLNDNVTITQDTCVYTLVSGNPTNHTGADATGFTSDGTVRTLEIVGNGGTSKARVGANLNIIMDSAGNTQSFTGDMSLFTGDINVNAGTLGISGALTIARIDQLQVASGGTAILDGPIAIANGATFSVADGGTLEFSSSVAVSGGQTSESIPTRETGNGFNQVIASATVGAGASGSATWTLNGHSATYDATSGVVSFQGDGSTYYIFTPESISDVMAKNPAKIVVDTLTETQDLGNGLLGDNNLDLVVNTGIAETSIGDQGGTGYLKGHTITINGGGTFRATGHHDIFGWGDNKTGGIVLTGTDADHLATLDLAFNTDASATMATNLTLNGYSRITDSGANHKGFNTYGGSITVSGADNVIEHMSMRNAVTVAVDSGADLAINWIDIDKTTGAGGNFTKTGDGSLTIGKLESAKGGAAQVANVIGALAVNAGEVAVQSGESRVGSITMGADTEAAQTTPLALSVAQGGVMNDAGRMSIYHGMLNVNGELTAASALVTWDSHVNVSGLLKVTGELDSGNSGHASAQYLVKTGGELSVGGTLYWTNTDNLLLEQGGKLTLVNNFQAVGLDGGGSFYRTANRGQYSIGNTEFVISRAEVTTTHANTIKNKLDHVKLNTGAYAITLENSGDILDAATVAANGSLNITAGATINSTIENAGTVTLAGTMTVDQANRANYAVVEGSQGSYNHGTSGYLSEEQYYLVQGGNATTTATLSGGYWVETQPEGGLAFTFNLPQQTMFYVNEDMATDKYSDFANATGITIAKDAVLTAAGTGAVTTAAAQLHGEGAYALAGGAIGLNSGLTLSADWTGRVVLSGPAGTTVTAINLQNSAPGTENAVSTSLSTIELRGIQGWLAHSGTGAANANDANLILTNPEAGVSALKLDNGSTNATTYFTGSISGSGDLEHAWTKSTPALEMSGDLSGWTGNIVKSSSGTVGFTLNNNPGGNIAVGALAKAGTLNLTVKNGSAVTLSGNFAQSGGTLNLTVNANATFSGTLSGVSSLSVESGKTATLVKAATVGGLSGAGSVSADSVTLNGTGSSTLNGAVSVTNRLVKDGSGTQTFSGDAVLNGLTINAGTLKFTREGGVSVNALSGTGGTLDVADTLAVANADASEFGGTLAVGGLVKDGAGTLTLHGISRIENGIDMQGGALVFAAGTYNLGGLENTHSEGYSEETHGYVVTSDTVRLVNTGVGVSAADGANFVIGSVQGAALLDDGYVGKTATDYSTYFLVDGTGVDLNREIDKGRGLSSVNVLEGTGTIGLSAYASLSGLTLAGGSAAAITGGHELTLTGNSVIGAGAHVDIGEGSALRLMHGGSAAAVVMSATGAGDIVLGVSATLSNNATTAATGKLSVGTGATLTIGTGDSQNNNLSSFSGVELDGGRIYWNSAGAASGTTSMKNLSTTSRGGTFQIYDINGNPIVLGGTTTLNGNLTLENSVWGNGLTIQKLTGTGSLNATSTNSSDSLTLAINSIEDFSGGISIVNPKTTLNANMGDDVKLAHLTLNAGTANIKGDFSAGALIGSGSGNLHLDNVTLDVTADSSYSGTLSIGGKLVKNGAGRQTLSVGTVENPFLMNEVYDLNAGTLALAGHITLNQGNFTPASSTYVDTNGGEHALGQGSGYQTAKGEVTVVNVESGATLDVADANFTYNGRKVDVNAQGRFTLPEQETDYDSYYVFTDNTSLLEVQQTSTGMGESLTDLYLQESGLLNAAGASKLATLHVKDTTVEGDVANLAGPASVGNLTGRGILSVNGSLNADTVGADATATLTLAGVGTATIGSLENGATGSLVFSGASATIGGNSTYAGNITIAGSVKVTGEGSLGSMDASLHTITIAHGGILDVNGHEGTKQGSLDGYTVVFAGGTLTNTGTDKGSGMRQYVTHATLTADSTINAQREFGITGSGYAATSLDLGEYTLEKTGGNTFWLSKTTVTGSGSIKVTQGTLAFQQGGTYAANIELAGGNVSGSLNLGGDVSVSASANASMGEVNLNGHALNANAASGKTLRVTDAVSGGDSSTIRKTGEGAVALSGSMANFSGSIDAQEGILNIFNQSALNVQDVVLANGATVGAYTTAAVDETNEATLTISGTLAAKGADGRLNANLVMESGSTLDVRATGGAGLLMGSEVTLSKGMTLNDYSSDWATWKDGTTYTLFTGVDGLDIGNGVTTGTMDYTQWVDAKEYFDNIKESNRYFLCFGGAPDQNAQGVLTAVKNGSNVGMVYIMTMPEPTTSTLSLLALAALAARRRRNS